MNRRTHAMQWICVGEIPALVCVAVLGALAQSANGLDPQGAKSAAATEIARASGAPGGFCALVGAADADLALALAQQGAFVVQCLCKDEGLRDRARKAIRSQRAYGAVSADTLESGRLPYAENLINILVIESDPAAEGGFAPEEAMRVLAPLGVVILEDGPAAGGASAWAERFAERLRSLGMTSIADFKPGAGWVGLAKPWPADIDEWGHYLHGPDGNPVAQDRVVGPPRRLQWTSDPVYMRSHETDSSISTMVTARGRLFYIEDQAPISLEGDRLPDKWLLVARDAFNGAPLWKRPIEDWGWRAWKNTWFTPRPGDIPLNVQKRLVAAGDKVYVTLGYHAPVSELDARTGKTLQTYAGTEGAGEILHRDGTLVLSVLSGDGLKVMAVNAATGKPLWTTNATYAGSTVDYVKWNTRGGDIPAVKLDPALNAATDGKVVAFLDGRDLACLDFRTGAEKWRAPFPTDPQDLKAGRVDSQGNLWIGTLIVSDGVVVHASPSKLAAFSTDTGKLLWSQPKKYLGHLWYEWKDVFVINGLVWTWSADLGETTVGGGAKGEMRELWPKSANGYDIHTGQLKRQVPTGSAFSANHHHRCYRDKATVRYILASRRGSEYIDLEGGNHTIDNWVRGTCHVGMMPANGLQYATPHACSCYIEEKLNGMNALAPEAPAVLARKETGAAPRLERGPAFGQVANGPDASAEDWPTFLCDAARAGFVNTATPEDVKPLWQIKAGAKVSPPIAVADRLYASLVDEHHVICLDVKDGRQVWEFAAGARVDSPPTYVKGAIVFGAADGWVYCLRAADGQMAWRFRAAPEQRLIGAFGQLESAWPAHGSVLAQGGAVYFAAGRSSHLDGGLYVYAVDVATGGLLHQTKLEGPEYTADDLQVNNRLPMGALPDILMVDKNSIFMRSVAFDMNLQQQQTGRPALQVRGGFLDDAYFKRTPWYYGAPGNYGNLIVRDPRAAYFLRMFDSLRGLTPTVYFAPGDKGYQLFSMSAQDVGAARRQGTGTGAETPKAKEGWSQRIPVRGRAMAVAEGRLFVAGPPDVVDPKDPLGAFEGRKGGVLCVFDTATGRKLSEQKISSSPVFNGIAAANQRLYLATEDGSLACFGRP